MRAVSGSGLDPDPQLLAWIALRRVQRGGVVRTREHYLDRGRPVPGYLIGAFDELTTTGLLTLVGTEPIAAGPQRVTTTDTGRARYVALCRQLKADLSPLASHEFFGIGTGGGRPRGRGRAGSLRRWVPSEWVPSEWDRGGYLLRDGLATAGTSLCGHTSPAGSGHIDPRPDSIPGPGQSTCVLCALLADAPEQFRHPGTPTREWRCEL